MKKVDLEEKQLLEGVPHWLKGLLLLLVGLFLFAAYRYFTDGYYWNGEKWTIREDYRERVIGKMESFDDCVVYYLIARTAGYYPCRHCDRETFYLLAGETWKIGNSCNEQERYDEDWLKKMNMDMKIVYEGDLTGAAKEEVRHIANYGSMPENMSRPDPTPEAKARGRYKLLYPPANFGLK